MVCPDLESLERYLADDLEDDSRRSIARHVQSCAACSSMLTELEQNQRLEGPVRAMLTRPDRPAPVAVRASGVGQYRIIRELGRGGMGVVYEAEQENPRRRVALKLLTCEGASDPRYERLFRREAQALARLRHPSIAAIYEAGRTEDEWAFIAMELVEGETLTSYARRNSLSVPQRLRLFNAVCETAAYAHQRGVIHRDLKPSNVLVESSGTPKVLDFGLAKILEPAAEDSHQAAASAVTEIGRVAGTLPYMSPEHVRGRSHDIDVRSDVYSLGVILYELLTGTLPYSVEQLSLPAAARVICEQPATPPSRAVRAVRGDLETIVLKALEKDPDRRYQSAAEFAADIGRSLRNEPIVARPAGTWYQIGRFARRNRALVATFAVLLAAMIGLTSAALGQAYVANRERDAAQRRLAYARQAANYVFAGVGSQIGRVLGTGDIQRHLAEEAYVFYRRLAEESPDDPDEQAWLWLSLRRLILISLEVGDRRRAAALADQLRGLVEGTAAGHPHHPRVLRELMYLHIVQAEIADDAGRSEDAAHHVALAYQAHRDVLDWYERNVDLTRPEAWEVPREGPFAGREPAHLAARMEWAHALTGPAGRVLMAADPQEAERQYREALSTFEQLLPNDPTRDPLYREDTSEYAPLAPPILLRVSSRPYHGKALAALHTALGRLAAQRGDDPDAETHFQAALQIARELVEAAPDDPGRIERLAAVDRELAEWMLLCGGPRVAKEHALAALAGHQRLTAADPKNVAWRREVAADYQTLLETVDGSRPPAPDTLGLDPARQGQEQREWAAALLALRRSTAEGEQATGSEIRLFAANLLDIEPVDMQDPHGAVSLAGRAVEITGGQDPRCLEVLARAWHRLGDAARAVDVQRQAVGLLPADAPERAAYEEALATYETIAQPANTGRGPGGP